MFCECSERDMAKQMTLRWRGTFIDVDNEVEMPCRRTRSLSESCLKVNSSEDWAGFGQEQAYVQSLSQKLASLSRDVRCAAVFFEGKCKVGADVLCECGGGADNLSSASTSMPTEQAYVQSLSQKLASLSSDVRSAAVFFKGNCKVGANFLCECGGGADNLSSASTSMPTSGSTDVVSDTSSQAVLPETVDEAMQLVQGMIRTAGLNLSKVVDGPQQLPEGSGIQNAMNTSVADMIMQVKADAWKGASGVDSSRLGLSWADASADSQDALASPILESSGCSRGSVGHPELCSRPCLYFATGSCENGTSCEYCHMAHSKRPAHPDKRHREMLRSMPPLEWVALMLPILQQKVEAVDGSLVTRAMFGDIAAHCGIRLGSVSSFMPQRSQRMLILTLRSMSLMCLLNTVQHGLSQHGHPVEEAVEELLLHLRRLAGHAAEPLVQLLPQL
eukprot:CAMPEP_0183599232 /NCGR_PEP_ID=MMETSP0371-20130417/179328_1 /TAXON_ID=268820 /ORGANISM="Peridinium aciculiferum, Strain PAER-2" /LENGTH=445 /DNA_ID=CAMNT_0025811297 /DNA_START=111 /DNA_END=1449 /DNA_ORIENTATION=-